MGKTGELEGKMKSSALAMLFEVLAMHPQGKHGMGRVQGRNEAEISFGSISI